MVPYNGDKHNKEIKTIGPGWDALFQFWAENIGQYNFLENFRFPLLYHWSQQFESDDVIPEIAKEAAKICFDLLALEGESYTFRLSRNVLEILFLVIPVAQEEVKDFLDNLLMLRTQKSDKDSKYGFSVSFYRSVIEMLLIETFRCELVYKYFPEIVIALAKIEWFRNKKPTELSMDYSEQSFGLSSHPYEYFSPSANQTPFKYLFKYHFDLALDFLLELSNRGLLFYRKTSYAKDLIAVEVKMSDGVAITLWGNYALWATYRGYGSTPYLIQSALMAFEIALFEAVENGVDLKSTFISSIKKSDTILLLGVFAGVATNYPFAFGIEVLLLISSRVFFKWDIERYANEFSGDHTTIGNDRYYTYERYQSNQLRYRKLHLENLVSYLQYFIPDRVNPIIDDFLKRLDKRDEKWRLALIRMDLRNTEPAIDEEAQTIQFNPKPLPEELKKRLDSHTEAMSDDTSAVSIYLWANKAFENEPEVQPSYEEWGNYFEKAIAINYEHRVTVDPRPSLAALGLKDFSEQLNDVQAKFCVEILITKFDNAVYRLKQGNSFGDIDDIKKNSIFIVFPKLLTSSFHKLVSVEKVKSLILDVLLLPSDNQRKSLITGISTFLWRIDSEYADVCFKVLLKESYQEPVYVKMRMLRQQGDSEFVSNLEKIIEQKKIVDKDEIFDIDFKKVNKDFVLDAIKLVPFEILSTDYSRYLRKVISEVSKMKTLEEYDDLHFISGMQELLARFLVTTCDGDAAEILNDLLNMYPIHPKFVNEFFNWFIACAHDYKYPESVSFVVSNVFNYLTTKSPKVAFASFILFSSLKQPLTANKLPNSGDIKQIHEIIISNWSGDPNLFESVCQLLAGIGSIYQPDSLNWLRKAIKNKAEFGNAFANIISIQYAELYVQQLYDIHIHTIKRDRELLDYYLLFLEALIDKGSTTAYRILEIVI